jgi:hypothetical protein
MRCSSYIVLYFQNAQHFSALGCGWRLAIITAGALVTALPAGRLSARIPGRFLIEPGLLLVGIGLLSMRGLSADSSWTHLIPGFIVAWIGRRSGVPGPGDGLTSSIASSPAGLLALHRRGRLGVSGGRSAGERGCDQRRRLARLLVRQRARIQKESPTVDPAEHCDLGVPQPSGQLLDGDLAGRHGHHRSLQL